MPECVPNKPHKTEYIKHPLPAKPLNDDGRNDQRKGGSQWNSTVGETDRARSFVERYPLSIEAIERRESDRLTHAHKNSSHDQQCYT